MTTNVHEVTVPNPEDQSRAIADLVARLLPGLVQTEVMNHLDLATTSANVVENRVQALLDRLEKLENARSSMTAEVRSVGKPDSKAKINSLLRRLDQFEKTLSGIAGNVAQASDTAVKARMNPILLRLDQLENALARVPGGGHRSEPEPDIPENPGWQALQWTQVRTPVSEGEDFTADDIKIPDVPAQRNDPTIAIPPKNRRKPKK